MDEIGSYDVRRFPESRNSTLDTLDLGRKKHHIPALFEVDVTRAREVMRELKERTGEGLSFTAWVLACIGQAVSEHKHVQAMRKGKRNLVLFDDVDISVLIERSVAREEGASQTLPMPYVVRKANEKTVRQIHDEIRAAQTRSLGQGEVQIGARRSARLARAFNRMPAFVRYVLVWRRLARDPFFAKKSMGTVVVTSVGNVGQSSGYAWAIPVGIHPLAFALGSIARKPGIVGEEIRIREYLSVTLLFDHDVTDGAPVARFLRRLSDLLEQGYGLGGPDAGHSAAPPRAGA